jgi:hypothetical protein
MANGRKNKRAADGRINTLAQTGCYTSDYTHTHTHTQRDFFFSLLGWNRVTSFRLWSRRRPSVFLSPMFFGVGRIDPVFRRKPLCVCVPPARSLDCFEPCTNIQWFNQKTERTFAPSYLREPGRSRSHKCSAHWIIIGGYRARDPSLVYTCKRLYL